MSGHLQSCIAAFLLTGLSISGASANPLTDLYSFGSKEAPAPTPTASPAQEACLSRPGKLTSDGRRWVYRLEGHRKCWHETAEEIVASAKKRVRHYAVKQRATAHEKKEAALRRREADANARAEVLRSAPAGMVQPSPAPELNVADAAPIPAMRAAALMPPTPLAESISDQLSNDNATSRAAALDRPELSSSVNDTIIAPVLPAIPVASRPAKPREDGWGWAATWVGTILMALGLASVLSSGLPRLFSRFE